jgi:hypothetical protein
LTPSRLVLHLGGPGGAWARLETNDATVGDREYEDLHDVRIENPVARAQKLSPKLLAIDDSSAH